MQQVWFSSWFLVYDDDDEHCSKDDTECEACESYPIFHTSYIFHLLIIFYAMLRFTSFSRLALNHGFRLIWLICLDTSIARRHCYVAARLCNTHGNSGKYHDESDSHSPIFTYAAQWERNYLFIYFKCTQFLFFRCLSSHFLNAQRSSHSNLRTKTSLKMIFTFFVPHGIDFFCYFVVKQELFYLFRFPKFNIKYFFRSFLYATNNNRFLTIPKRKTLLFGRGQL